MNQLDIYLDLGNISGYMALKVACDLAEKVDVRWLPIRGVVPRPLSREPKQLDDDPIGHYKKRRWKAKRAFEAAELERDCARLGILRTYAEKTFDAHLTHLGWLALVEAKMNPLPYIRAVYEARFVRGKALEDLQSVQRLLQQSGLASYELDQIDWQTHEAHYLELGIHDSPSFVVNGETFQGRQHYPLITWRLNGEQGPMPV